MKSTHKSELTNNPETPIIRFCLIIGLMLTAAILGNHSLMNEQRVAQQSNYVYADEGENLTPIPTIQITSVNPSEAVKRDRACYRDLALLDPVIAGDFCRVTFECINTHPESQSFGDLVCTSTIQNGKTVMECEYVDQGPGIPSCRNAHEWKDFAAAICGCARMPDWVDD